MPDSQESLYASVTSVMDDPRGSPPGLEGAPPQGLGDDRSTRGRSGRPIDVGSGHQSMPGDLLDVALNVPPMSREPFDVALGNRSMSDTHVRQRDRQVRRQPHG